MTNWDQRFIDMAYMVASWSKDPSTKCGAVITDDKNRMLSIGFNGFPRGVDDDPERYNNREEKYKFVVHSEKNAILNSRHDLDGATLYVVPMPPCSQCAAAIVQAGIKKVVTILPTEDQISRWELDFTVMRTIFEETGVEMIYFNKIDEPDHIF